ERRSITADCVEVTIRSHHSGVGVAIWIRLMERREDMPAVDGVVAVVVLVGRGVCGSMGAGMPRLVPGIRVDHEWPRWATVDAVFPVHQGSVQPRPNRHHPTPIRGHLVRRACAGLPGFVPKQGGSESRENGPIGAERTE